jgi:uncharacterized protein (TIGR02147 family)
MAAINIYKHTDYRAYLRAWFEERKKSDPKFSHRYLCRRLGLTSPNFIMLVMQGKRSISRSLAFRISEEFKHSARETEYFESMVGFAQAKTMSEKDRYFSRMMGLRKTTSVEKIDESRYRYYSNWYNVVVRELATSPLFKGDYNWLAKNVRPVITPSQARRSIELLLKLGFIRKKGKDFVHSSAMISTGPEVTSLAVANFHKTMAGLAAEAVNAIRKEDRDMTACTVYISQKGFEEIIKAVAECRKKVLAIAETDEPVDRVYQINFQVFPVSKTDFNPPLSGKGA